MMVVLAQLHDQKQWTITIDVTIDRMYTIVGKEIINPFIHLPLLLLLLLAFFYIWLVLKNWWDNKYKYLTDFSCVFVVDRC